jgi:hypothetical protein
VAAVLVGWADNHVSNVVILVKVIVRIWVCDESWAQVLISMPSVITQLPQLCPNAVMARVVVCDESWVQIPVSSPAVVHVGAVVSVQL